MRTVYAFLITSLDGYHADLDGSTDWFVMGPELEEYSRAQSEHIDTIVMGRRTFEFMAAYWPTAAAVAADPVVAGFMNDLPKVVASRTLTEHPWGPTTFVADDVAGHLAALRHGPGKDIAVFGSSALVASLLAAGVIDELRVAVMPVVLGAGRPVLAGADGPALLDQVGLRMLDSTVLVTYRPRPGLG